MSDEQREWTTNKRNLILHMMRLKFEDRVYEYLDSGDYQSIEELDNWIDIQLRQFEDERAQVKEYYASNMYS